MIFALDVTAITPAAIAMMTMNSDDNAALTLLSQADRLFFSHRASFARLVMAGLARCYVRADGTEWTRLTTTEERTIAAKYSKQAVTV